LEMATVVSMVHGQAVVRFDVVLWASRPPLLTSTAPENSAELGVQRPTRNCARTVVLFLKRS